ncbi:Hypothetical predicted protein, partial [Mytilus galloprovincialis]
QPALYEFGQNSWNRSTISFVYCKCNKGFMLDKGSWESRLLNTSDVRTEVEDVLKKGFRLFVRRFPLKKTCTTSNKMTDLGHYDYAWRGQRKERTSPRVVEYKL